MARLQLAVILLAMGDSVRAGRVNWRQEVNTPMTQSPPVPTSSATLSTTIRTDYSCDGTTFFGALGNLYSSLSTDPSLQCQCEKTAYEWLFTSDPATITRTRVNANGLTTFTSTVSGIVTTITSQLLSTTTIVKTPGLGAGNDAGGTVNGDWIGTAKPPCCYSCTIAASTVDLIVFNPTPTNPSAETSYVTNGYTFVSPSLYIGFSSLYAYDFCGTLGDVFTATTIAFAPDELSTVLLKPYSTDTFTASTGVSTRTWYSADGSTALNVHDVAQNCSTLEAYTYVAGDPSAAGASHSDPCHPTIIIPDRVRSLNPLWESCVPDAIGGFYDPPSVLTPKNVLVPTTTEAPVPTTSIAIPTAPTITTHATTVPADPDHEPTTSSSAVPPPPTSSIEAPPPSTTAAVPLSSTNPPSDSTTPLAPAPPTSSSPTSPGSGGGGSGGGDGGDGGGNGGGNSGGDGGGDGGSNGGSDGGSDGGGDNNTVGNGGDGGDGVNGGDGSDGNGGGGNGDGSLAGGGTGSEGESGDNVNNNGQFGSGQGDSISGQGGSPPQDDDISDGSQPPAQGSSSGDSTENASTGSGFNSNPNPTDSDLVADATTGGPTLASATSSHRAPADTQSDSSLGSGGDIVPKSSATGAGDSGVTPTQSEPVAIPTSGAELSSMALGATALVAIGLMAILM